MGQRAILAVSSLRSRAGALASTQLRGAAGEGYSAGALGKLEDVVRGSASSQRSVERMRKSWSGTVPSHSRSTPSLLRRRHRARQHAWTPHRRRMARARRVRPSQCSAPVRCDEPIRTRTFARLLAAQGHVERALSIYAYLIEQQLADVALLDEVAVLRAGQAGQADGRSESSAVQGAEGSP